MKKILPNRYFKEHPIDTRSGAYLMYAMNASEDVMSRIRKIKEDHVHVDDEQAELEKVIAELEDPAELFRFMRKELDGCNGEVLRDRLLKFESSMTPMIREKILTTKNERFIDNAAFFFIRGEKDPGQWILENYADVQDPFARSMMCLTLGFWGEEKYTDFLVAEEERFSREYPGKKLEQGPLIALYMLEELARWSEQAERGQQAQPEE